jgi:16S rRNA (uracil1498-N3)-methyltransferase
VHRFYVSREQINNGTATINGEEYKHLARVLRLVPGDLVVVFDGAGWEYDGVIKRLQDGQADVSLTSSRFLPRESALEVWLAQGLPKGDKMELIIQKATELGVRGIIPLELERSIVKLDEKKKKEKRERWQKIAVEAVKQSRRSLIPQVLQPCSLELFLGNIPQGALLLVPWEEGGASLKGVLEKTPSNKPVYIIIGPEGGLSEKEVALARSSGAVTVSLGPRILRTETAGLAAVTAVMYQWGDLGA